MDEITNKLDELRAEIAERRDLIAAAIEEPRQAFWVGNLRDEIRAIEDDMIELIQQIGDK